MYVCMYVCMYVFLNSLFISDRIFISFLFLFYGALVKSVRM